MPLSGLNGPAVAGWLLSNVQSARVAANVADEVKKTAARQDKIYLSFIVV